MSGSADFLLELLCEEIPARMQAKACEDLERLFRAELALSGITDYEIKSLVTPRRLALIAHSLPEQTQTVSEEHKGPRTSAPHQALEGFLRKTGLTQDQLEDRDGIWFATVEKPGRATADVLAAAIPAIVRAFPWPKSMRWGGASTSTESLRWVRPLQGVVALLDNDIIPLEIEGISSGRTTAGHRFHGSTSVSISSPATYADDLRAAHVIVDQAERARIIAERAHAAASAAGYTLIEDAGLVAENAGLTEWPVPLLGHFDPAFLEVPPEVIQLTLRTNQKYFVLRDANGKLAPAFICTANIDASDGGTAIIAGNGKVLAARLSDARFFWEQDKKTKLADHAKKLERITFHEKLGTVADKVERVAKLAEWLASEGIVPNCDPALARQAAELCKADLVTEMVGEFPELQGLMGGYYARAEDLDPQVADAIRDHYKPVGQGDDVPIAPVTVAVSLADKLDTLCSFFAADMAPTGSKDPYALRRAAYGMIALLVTNDLRLKIFDAIFKSWDSLGDTLEHLWREHPFSRITEREKLIADLIGGIFLNAYEMYWGNSSFMTMLKAQIINGPVTSLFIFFADRLKVQQREAGVRHDLIDAVFALGGEDDLVRLLARVHALQSFITTEDGANLLAGYKRAANILKKEEVDPATLPAAPSEPAEIALASALDTAEPQAAAAIEAEQFEVAMAALASLRAPIDAFFDPATGVMVNDSDPAKRAARLALLVRVRAAVHKVADFSRIEG